MSVVGSAGGVGAPAAGVMPGGFVPAEAAGAMALFTGSERRNLEAVRQAREMMERMSWSQISLINLHPWSLTANGYLQHDLKLAGVPPIEDWTDNRLKTEEGRELAYSQHVYTEFLIDSRPQLSGDHAAVPVLPLELAVDFISQHSNQNEMGGLFCYEGSQAPWQDYDAIAYLPVQSVTNVGKLPRISLKEALNTAHKRQVEAYIRMVEIAQNRWDKPGKGERQGASISINDRKAAKCLRAWGVLQKDPDWMVVTQRTGAPLIVCPVCQAEAKPGQIKCMNGQCGHIFDPFKAITLGLIDLDTPGAVTALRRLTKAQLIELTLYPAVLPMDEYKQQLVKQAKQHGENEGKGKRKSEDEK